MIPKIIFIIPYRNRPEQLYFFNTYMSYILEDYEKNFSKIYIIEQNSEHKDFNRGAVKNIGFLAMKKLYPNDYKNITFVFNDVDTIPYKKNILNYETTNGTIKHFYGKEFALGGIVSIKGSDFERIGGFPNYWTWGHEDVVIAKRAIKSKLIIDRSTFFELGSPVIIQLNNDSTRSLDIATSFVDIDPMNNLNVIMNLNYTLYDNNTVNNNYVYINNFNLAISKIIYNHTIDLKKGQAYHQSSFGKIREKHKAIYGDKKVYYINNIPGAKEHLINNNFDLHYFRDHKSHNKDSKYTISKNIRRFHNHKNNRFVFKRR